MLENLLSALADFSWRIDTSISSVFLFGELPYPQKEDYDD